MSGAPHGGLTAWLLALADPAGPLALLPRRVMSADELRRLPELADWHGVLPAVARNLAAVGPAAGEPAALESARGSIGRLLVPRVVFTLVCRRQSETLAAELARRGVPFLPLKGAEFADRLYPDPALRPFTDVDLLVPPDAVPEAGAALAAAGYERAPEPPRKHADYGEQTWHLPRQPSGAVELHWDLVNSPPLRRRISVTYHDLAVEPGPDGRPRATAGALLAVAAVHAAAGHRFDRVQNLCDICQSARGAAGEPDAEWLASFAARTGSGPALADGLALAGSAFAEPACRRLAERLPDGMPGRVVRLLLTPAVVVRSQRPLGKLRRQLYREWLKRR